MKKSGFTLVELMVVMAIIAILATAGISGYSGYIKNARDTVRIADIKAIETIVLASMSVDGKAPDITALKASIVQANGTAIKDPLSNTSACLTSAGTGICDYKYAQCDGGVGYIITTTFESKTNLPKYVKDDGVGAYIANTSNAYAIGNCSDIGVNTLSNTY